MQNWSNQITPALIWIKIEFLFPLFYTTQRFFAHIKK
jgi:hypothetical protein